MNALLAKMSPNNDTIRSSIGKVVEPIVGADHGYVSFQGTSWQAIALDSSQTFHAHQEVKVVGRIHTLILVVAPLG